MPAYQNDGAKGLMGGPVDAKTYETWFQEKVHEALMDKRPTRAHSQVMDEAQALIERKRRTHS